MKRAVCLSMGLAIAAMAARGAGAEVPNLERPLSAYAAAQDNPQAPPAGNDAEELSQKLNNPIANLVSVPFQFNYDQNAGLKNGGDRLTLNVQPIIPFGLTDEWLLITRTIVPLVYQSDVTIDGGSEQYGLGDVQQSFFFSPTHATIPKVTWGVGPVFLYPTASNDSLGGEKFGMGPAAILLYQDKPWTIGALANHIWSIGGVSDREDVNVSFLQPFVAYELGKGLSAVAQLEASYDWQAGQATVPFSAGLSQVLPVGRDAISLGFQGRYWLEGPDGAPEWGLRFVFTLVLPN